MLTGLVAGGHARRAAVARATRRGRASIHAAQKTLSRHPAGAHGNPGPVAAALLGRSAAPVTDGTPVVAGTTDPAECSARKLGGAGRVHGGSAPEGRTAPGACTSEALVRVGAGPLVPRVVEPLEVYAGAPGRVGPGVGGQFVDRPVAPHRRRGDRGPDGRRVGRPRTRRREPLRGPPE